MSSSESSEDVQKGESNEEKSSSSKRDSTNNGSRNVSQHALWERSQSDANLSVHSEGKGKIKVRVDEEEHTRTKVQQRVSEQSRVYWDIPGAVAVEDPKPTDSTEGQKEEGASGYHHVALETIHQHQVLSQFSSSDCITCGGANVEGGEASESASSAHTTMRSHHSYHHRAASYTMSAGGASSLDSLDTAGAGYVSSASSYSSLVSAAINRSNIEGMVKPGPGHSSEVGGSGSAYFCESDFDDRRECRPNYEAQMRALQDAMIDQLCRLRNAVVEGGPVWDILSEQTEQLYEQCQALEECDRLLTSAWEMPEYGRDCATTLCDLIRSEGVLDYLVLRTSRADQVLISGPRNASGSDTQLVGETTPTGDMISVSNSIDDDEARTPTTGPPFPNMMTTSNMAYNLVLCAAHLFSQVLTQENMDALVDGAEDGVTPTSEGGQRGTGRRSGMLLDMVVRQSWTVRKDAELSREFVGILEGLLKHRKSTCRLVVTNGGLRSLIFACRSSDPDTLCHAAVGLANLSLYGGSDNQLEIIRHNVADWLFPLAFHRNDVIQYYACLAIVVLSSNRELWPAVKASGTLHLVLPWVRSHSPEEFARRVPFSRQGRSMGWLERLLPMLVSEREEPQALAAFHFAMEAIIKRQQRKTEIFTDIGAVDVLRQVASSPRPLASRLAVQTLECLGEDVPQRLSHQVPIWSEDDVQHWLSRIGFEEFAHAFSTYHVDGDCLLTLTEQSLKDDLGLSNGIQRKRFFRELRKLKLTSSYRSVDPSGVYDWLRRETGYKQLAQYTYGLVTAGVDRRFLAQVTEDMLREDCGVLNGVHRRRIMCAIEQASSADVINDLTMRQPGRSVTSPSDTGTPLVASVSADRVEDMKRLMDFFISYRRSNGSQLASLLKVHLQLRGYSVYLDIERLAGGKFDESLLRSIAVSRNFLLILTPDSLDRCKGDDECKDWIHKEIVGALESQCNIIPVMDRFEWPTAESLPEDMRPILSYNGVAWVHDYQEACVDKLEKFMRRPSAPSSFTTHRRLSNYLQTPCPCCQQIITPPAGDS